MAKKVRVILCSNEEFEKRVYHYCDKYGVKDKDISTSLNGDLLFVNIYSKKKIFNQITFKLGWLNQINYYQQ